MKFFLICLLVCFESLGSFQKVVIWGHKIHSHTHSYIHNGFYRAFQYLGYPTYWFDDNDDVSGFDFSDTLFLTEGQVDKKIPLREDCYYILHYCNAEKYLKIFELKRCVFLQVFTKNLTSYDCFGKEILGAASKKEDLKKIENCVYYDLQKRIVYMPWATDLLPEEINKIKNEMPFSSSNEIYWVGTLSDGPGGNVNNVNPFQRACRQKKINFVHKNPWIKGVSVEENIFLIQNSYIAPAIVGDWQNEVGYIPCRIFKNISYGKMGVTNSEIVYNLFDQKIVYNPDTYQLFFDAEKVLSKMTLNDLFEQMDFVREKHTYLNRIEVLLNFPGFLIQNE